VRIPQVLWRSEQFASQPSVGGIAVTVTAAFVLLAALEWLLFAAFSAAARATRSPILAPRASRIKLGRRALEVLSMSVLAALGVQAHEQLGGLGAFGALSGDAAVARALEYHPLSARLALAQLAYQCFNSYISVRDRDGMIFIGHHLATGLLCALAQGPFLHAFAPFFLGLTETSTVLLCALATFDPDPRGAGVPGLGALFPVTTQLLGVVFTLAFIAVRIVIWPCMSLLFWVDVLAVLGARAHPPAVCYAFLVTNAGLSALQVLWLGEIVSTAVTMFAPQRRKVSAAAALSGTGKAEHHLN